MMLEPVGDPVGIYILQTINGESLPFVLVEVEEDMIEVLSGSVTLRNDQTFTDATTFRITEAGEVSTEEDIFSGTWVRTGNTIRFFVSTGETQTMTFDGENRLTQVVEGFTLVYAK